MNRPTRHPSALPHPNVLGCLAAASLLITGPSAAAASNTNHASCPVSHVHYSSDPTAASGLRMIPWIATSPSGGFHAYLFFYGGTPWPRHHLQGARIFTTVKPRSINPKILWTTTRPQTGPTLLISGKRLDKPGHFSSRYPRASSGNQYPSYVEVPAAGCWRVTVTSGKLKGAITFKAVNSF